jgi:Rho GDP-dissociation inhibitor
MLSEPLYPETIPDTTVRGQDNSDDDDEEEDHTGYIAPEKKQIEEYVQLDYHDESLRRWKESLGLTMNSGTARTIGDPNDKRKLVLLSITSYVDGEEPIVIDFTDVDQLNGMQYKPVKVKQRTQYHLKIRFRIQHEIITGLHYYQINKRRGITFNKIREVCGAYAPNTPDRPYYEYSLPKRIVPGGFIARGQYKAQTFLKDDDNVIHVAFPWLFEITK